MPSIVYPLLSGTSSLVSSSGRPTRLPPMVQVAAPLFTPPAACDTPAGGPSVPLPVTRALPQASPSAASSTSSFPFPNVSHTRTFSDASEATMDASEADSRGTDAMCQSRLGLCIPRPPQEEIYGMLRVTKVSPVEQYVDCDIPPSTTRSTPLMRNETTRPEDLEFGSVMLCAQLAGSACGSGAATRDADEEAPLSSPQVQNLATPASLSSRLSHLVSLRHSDIHVLHCLNSNLRMLLREKRRAWQQLKLENDVRESSHELHKLSADMEVITTCFDDRLHLTLDEVARLGTFVEDATTSTLRRLLSSEVLLLSPKAHAEGSDRPILSAKEMETLVALQRKSQGMFFRQLQEQISRHAQIQRDSLVFEGQRMRQQCAMDVVEKHKNSLRRDVANELAMRKSLENGHDLPKLQISHLSVCDSGSSSVLGTLFLPGECQIPLEPLQSPLLPSTFPAETTAKRRPMKQRHFPTLCASSDALCCGESTKRSEYSLHTGGLGDNADGARREKILGLVSFRVEEGEEVTSLLKGDVSKADLLFAQLLSEWQNHQKEVTGVTRGCGDVHLRPGFQASPGATAAELWQPPLAALAVDSFSGTSGNPLLPTFLAYLDWRAARAAIEQMDQYQKRLADDANADGKQRVANPQRFLVLDTEEWPIADKEARSIQAGCKKRLGHAKLRHRLATFSMWRSKKPHVTADLGADGTPSTTR